MIRYGFDKDGGFIALDTERRVASYAYMSSEFAAKAAKDQAAIAAEMLAGESEWMHKLHPDFYGRMLAKLLEGDTKMITTNTMDMSDAASPEDAIRVLRNIALRFYEDAGELESAWQDKEAGKFWSRLASDLERVAVKAEGYKP